MKFLSIPMTVLRRTKRFFKEIKKKFELQPKIKSLLAANAAFFGLYGCIIGAFNGLPQALSSAVKLPLLFLLTLVVAFPTLYILNLLQGSKNTIGQYFALILGSTAVTSILLLGFAPITILFMITSDHYQFFKILNVILFAFSGFAGMKFFYQGMHRIGDQPTRPELIDTKPRRSNAAARPVNSEVRRKAQITQDASGQARPQAQQPASAAAQAFIGPQESGTQIKTHKSRKHHDHKELKQLKKDALARKRTLRAWVVLYGLIGSQLAWVLRPFFGAPGEEFEIFRNIDGNFFTNILEALASIFGFR